MKRLKQLTPGEVLFIGGETPNVYQHTAGLIILDCSDVPGYGFETFKRHMMTHLNHIPHFRWKLHEVPLGLDLPYWVEDENFNIENHIRRIAVPAPGDRQALADLVSFLYCRHLDRNKPLWEIWFIEGLPDGRFAFMQKLHHCTMDGEGATKLTEAMWDFEPDAEPTKPQAAIVNARPGEVPEMWRQSVNTALRIYGIPLRAGREIYEAIRLNLLKRMSGSGTGVEKQTAPITRFNRDIGSDRGLVFGSLPMADIKAVKNHLGATVNEVILGIVGGSLRDYLLERGELPEQSLRTSIAVSLRTAEDDEFSNKVTTSSVTLATDVQDPVERLQRIAEESRVAKEEAHHGGKGVLEFMQLFPPLVVNALMHLTPAERIPEMMGVNLVVSNVRGSELPMYVGGARAEAVYPMSIITPGGGLNVTCLSYAGQVHFGLTIDPDLVPDPWALVDGLRDSLDEYLARVDKPGASRKKPAARRAAAKSKAAKSKAAKPKAAKPKAAKSKVAKPKAAKSKAAKSRARPAARR
jgi:diacylglycerol O-acyltransferase